MTPHDLRKQLDSTPGYDVLYLACHGNEHGALLLEDGRGWARHVGARELTGLVGGKVGIFVLGACYGELSLADLFAAPEGHRPPGIVYARGEHPIPSRAVQLFSEGFHRSLADGHTSTDAFREAVESVRWDDHVGEVGWPDGMEDNGPSPYKRLELNEAQAVAFTSIAPGKLEVKDLGPPQGPHRRTIRADELIMGRETEIARLMGELLPRRSGLRETKSRLVHLHGEGGIGKTRLAQTVCDVLEDYPHFPGGIYEVDCESVPESRQLAVSILETLGVEAAEKLADPAAALEEAVNSLGDTLLMVDNVDPLFAGDRVEDTARLVKQLLTQCPQVRILSTARTQLHLGGYESDFLVDPLNPAVVVDLFVLCIPDQDIRAQVRSLPIGDMEYVLRLVAALEGHPLSIFLAAHRIGVGNDPIVQQLEQAATGIMGLLEAPELRGVPPRQRSVRASLDLSYNLLSERGKEVFRKSSFFPGGLYRHVSTLDSLLGDGWRDAAQEAADIGLFRFEREAQWYWTLNPVREYAGRMLLGEEGDEFRKQVCEHWASFTARQDFSLNPAQDQAAFAKLDLPAGPEPREAELARLHDAASAALRAEEANILFAFRWALKDDFKAAERIASSMMDYLKLYDKRQTSAWMARVTLEAYTSPEGQAKWLGILGNRLSDLGDRQGALAAMQEALGHYRKLAEKHPEAFLPYMATTLSNLGNRLSELGHRQRALAATQEALGHYRKLAEKHPEAFLPDMATTLNNLGGMLSEVGDRQGALAATQQSLDIRRKLAEKHPEAFLPDVATTLNNLGIMLSELGDRQGALDCFRELMDVGRRHSELTGNAALAVQGCIRLANFLVESGRNLEALPVLDTAVPMLEPVVEEHCDALRNLIEVNDRRVKVLRPQDPSKADEVAAQVEQQKGLYAKKCQPDSERQGPDSEAELHGAQLASAESPLLDR